MRAMRWEAAAPYVNPRGHPGAVRQPDAQFARGIDAGFGMLTIGARGATQVRGKDGVHPEIDWSKQFVK
jgi:hypothetical protein